MVEVSNINFLKVCLENSRSIMQRKKIYKKDYDFIMITLNLCFKCFNENKNNQEYLDLYKKSLVIFDIAYNKFYC